MRARWLYFALFMLAAGIYLGWDVYSDHVATQREVRARLAAHAAIIEQNLERQLLAVDRALTVVRTDLHGPHAAPVRSAAVTERFHYITTVIPGVRSLLLVDVTGACVASNRPELIGINFRDGERYRTISRDPNPERLYVSSPFKTPLGTFAIGLGKAILDRDGKFAGYLLAIIDPQFFRTLLGSVLYAPDMRAAVIHPGGKVVFRIPDPDDQSGADVAKAGSLFMSHMQSRQSESIQSGISYLGNELRVGALRTLRTATVPMDQPLVVVASRNTHATLQAWRSQTTTKVLLYGLLLLIGCGGLLLYGRRQHSFARISAQQEAERRRAEEELRESREHLSVTLHSIGDAVIATDAAGRITEMNPTAERYTGWRQAEARGRLFRDVMRIIDAQTRAEAGDPVRRVLETGEIVALSNHTTLIARDGSEYQIADSAAPIRHADGAISGVVMVFSDVTEKYRAQKSLAEREALLSAFTEHARIGMVMVTADHRYAFVNPAYAKSHGRKPGELLGKPLAEVLGQLYASRVRANLERAFAGEHVSDEIAECPPGSDSPLRYLEVNCAPPVQTSHGPCVVVLVTDITERKKAEAEQGQLAALFEGAHDAITLRAPGDIIVGWNPASERLFGWRKEEVIGKRYRELVSATPPDAKRNRFERVLKGETMPMLEDTRRRRDGSLIEVETTMSPVRDMSGRIVAVASITRDITARKRAERSRNLLAAAIESSNNAILIRDPQHNVVYCNKMVTQLFGYLPEELLGRDNEIMVPPELRARRSENWARLEQGIPVRNIETVRLRKDGTPLDVVLSASIVRDEHGSPIGIATVMIDISDRKRVQAALEASHNQLRAALESMSDAVYIGDVDGRIQEFNGAFATFHRFESKAACAKVLDEYPTMLEFRSSTGEALLPDQWPMARALRGETGAGVEFTVCRKDTGEHWIASYTFAPVRRANGAIAGFVVTGRDITVQKQSELARARLAAIVENSSEAIFSRALDGTISSWNKGAELMLGYTAAEAIGRHSDFTLAPECPSRQQQINAAVLDGRGSIGESVRVTRDGRVLYMRDSHSALRDEEGRIQGVVVILQDVTALRQAEAARRQLELQLIEAQKMQAIGNLAGGIAHDFNNIIATIIGNAEFARDDAAGNAGVLDSIAEILKASARAKDLVQQILSFSRRQPTELKRIRLEPVIQEAARLLRATLPRRVSLDVRCAPDVPPVMADSTQVQQVMINLSTNAAHAMPGVPGRISIVLDTVMLDEALSNTHVALRDLHARHPGQTVRIAVTDTGTGMDESMLKRIFEPFFTTKPVNEGTGLGLAVVHGIVQGHGGAILVQSEPGKGSTFTIYLPVAESAPEMAFGEGASTAAAKPADRPAGQRVLYVDDDEMLVSLITRTLERRGHTVSAHVSARQALAELRKHPDAFDLVLTDYNMPEMSGLDLAREVLAVRETLPVIVISGFIDDALLAQAQDAGVREVISKVDSAEQLVAAVQRIGRAG